MKSVLDGVHAWILLLSSLVVVLRYQSCYVSNEVPSLWDAKKCNFDCNYIFELRYLSVTAKIHLCYLHSLKAIED